jgi:hypothetical protein
MHTGCSRENLRKRDHLENLGVDGMVILKENLRVTYSKHLLICSYYVWHSCYVKKYKRYNI